MKSVKSSKESNFYSKAFVLAELAYAGEIRKNGEPLIKHAKRVTEILRNIGVKDDRVLSASILHDVYKLNKISPEELEKEFDSDIRQMVEILSDLSRLPIDINKNENTIQEIHKTLIHLSKDIRVLIIRLADRIDNIKTCEIFNKNHQEWIAKQALYIYAPIAKSVGIYVFAEELESEALKILQPQRYYEIKNFAKNKLYKVKDVIEKSVSMLEIEASKNSQQYEITYRTKSIYSIHNKANYKYSKGDISSPSAYDELFDLIGIRIIVDTEENCYKILSFIQTQWQIIQREYDDYISNPKPNGYKSIQMAVRLTNELNCEIQIRTFEMHQNNEYGPASHFGYKYSKSKVVDATWIKTLIQQKEQIQQEIIRDGKINLFENTVFVFTPQKDLISLPEGSTPVDFAYEIHSTIGEKCDKALADGKLIPLNSKLKSGQTIEIITSPNKKPSIDWLRTVKSPKAKEHLRRYFHGKGK